MKNFETTIAAKSEVRHNTPATFCLNKNFGNKLRQPNKVCYVRKIFFLKSTPLQQILFVLLVLKQIFQFPFSNLFAVVVSVSLFSDSVARAQVNVEPNTAVLNEGDPTELLCRYAHHSITYCRIEIPGENKVFNLSPDWNKTPGFTYFGKGLQNGECGVNIQRVKASNNGQVKCNLGVEGEELSSTIELVVACK